MASVGGLTALASTTARVAGMSSQRNKSVRQARRQILAADRKRKNIIDEQLASKRAKLGSLGISSSGSSLAAQNKTIKDVYDNNPASYNNVGSRTDYYKNLTSQIMGGVDKVLK